MKPWIAAVDAVVIGGCALYIGVLWVRGAVLRARDLIR